MIKYKKERNRHESTDRNNEKRKKHGEVQTNGIVDRKTNGHDFLVGVVEKWRENRDMN